MAILGPKVMHAQKCGPILWTLFRLLFIFDCFIFAAQDFQLPTMENWALNPARDSALNLTLHKSSIIQGIRGSLVHDIFFRYHQR